MSEPAPDDRTELRIDDLARAAGITTTTVRLYQTKGLLPPPRLVGRTGWYGTGHLDRLRLIAQLRDQGFSLAGIRALIERWEVGGDLDDLLGGTGASSQVLLRRTAVVVEPSDLLERFPADSMTPELLQRAGALGLVEITDQGSVRIPDDRFLEAGSALAHLGVPLERILDEWEELRTMTDGVAERFADLFEHTLLPTDWREQLDGARIDELTGTLAQLRRLGEEVLLAALDDSIARVASRRFAELAADTGPDGSPAPSGG